MRRVTAGTSVLMRRARTGASERFLPAVTEGEVIYTLNIEFVYSLKPGTRPAFLHLMYSFPPMYGRSTSGTMTVPSSC